MDNRGKLDRKFAMYVVRRVPKTRDRRARNALPKLDKIGTIFWDKVPNVPNLFFRIFPHACHLPLRSFDEAPSGTSQLEKWNASGKPTMAFFLAHVMPCIVCGDETFSSLVAWSIAERYCMPVCAMPTSWDVNTQTQKPIGLMYVVCMVFFVVPVRSEATLPRASKIVSSDVPCRPLSGDVKKVLLDVQKILNDPRP